MYVKHNKEKIVSLDVLVATGMDIQGEWNLDMVN